LASLMLTSPFLLYQIWTFVSPALYRQERRFALPFVILGTFSFVAGLAFSYYVVIPYGYKFLIEFGGDTDEAIITLTEYFGMTLKLMLALGLVFELPVLLMLLGKFGIISAQFLNHYRRHAVFLIFVVSAIATPSPDAFTMLIVAVPLWLLYELSVVGVWWVSRLKGKEEER
jgi:sec-independent protein translocase protein TatC